MTCDHSPAIMVERTDGRLRYRAECLLCGMHGQSCTTPEAAEVDWAVMTDGRIRTSMRFGNLVTAAALAVLAAFAAWLVMP